MVLIIKRLIRKFLRRENRYDKLRLMKANGLVVGSNFQMLEGCIIDDSHYWHIEIGDNVTLAPRVHIMAHDASTFMFLGYTKIKNVSIGNNVFIGASSIILPGVTIGDNVIIGAGSVVTKSIPGNCVYTGNPAVFICKTDEYISKYNSKFNDGVYLKKFISKTKLSVQDKIDMKNLTQKEGLTFI